MQLNKSIKNAIAPIKRNSIFLELGQKQKKPTAPSIAAKQSPLSYGNF